MSGQGANRGRLKGITREVLEPLWKRYDIKTSDMARALGVTRAGLSYHARETLKLPARRENRHKRCADYALFTDMWNAGVLCADIARHFGYAATGCVTMRRRDLGLPARRGKVAGAPSLEEFLSARADERLRLAMEASARQTAARQAAIRAGAVDH